MGTPEERLAALVAQAETVIMHHDCGELINPDALSLARSVIEHGSDPEPKQPTKFSFKLEGEPEAKADA